MKVINDHCCEFPISAIRIKKSAKKKKKKKKKNQGFSGIRTRNLRNTEIHILLTKVDIKSLFSTQAEQCGISSIV